MEYTITKQVQEKLKFEIPCFIRNGEYYYKIMNEEKILTVKNFSFLKAVDFDDLSCHNPFSSEGWEFISEKSFNETFIKVFSELEELLPKTVII